MKMLSTVLHSMVSRNDVKGNGSLGTAAISPPRHYKALGSDVFPCLVAQLPSCVSFLPVPSECRCVITPASVLTLLKDFHSVVYFIPLFKMTYLGIVSLVSKHESYMRQGSPSLCTQISTSPIQVLGQSASFLEYHLDTLVDGRLTPPSA